MGGRRSDRRRAAKDSKRATTATPPPPELFEAPHVDECDTQVFEVEMPDPQFRIVQRLQYHQGRLVEFAIILYLLGKRGGNTEQYSVDTKHGTLHAHPTGHRTSERQEVRPMFTQVDVQESFDIGYRMVEEWHVRANGG